jgi:cell division septation protein DedD
MGKRTVSSFVLIGLVAGFIAILAPAANALSSVENCFYQETNAERSSRGIPKLSLASDLTSIARKHSARMAADGTIYHNENLGNEISGNWYAAGENVGMGPDCKSIQDAFMSSPGHKSNILDRDYNQVGVGVAYDKDGTVYVTVDFAGRKSSTTTTTTHTTTTTRSTTTTTTHHTTTTRRATTTAHAAAAPKPAAKPKPRPVAPAQAAPMTVTVLVHLVGMDAQLVDPATGSALGV